ncbi:hypothetical protein [Pseudomonas donghuensis]|uniref:hypothetical protein n=1 Tax=Pseudomonas donghuensis TaxID=1163398 RepID=UPI002E148237|nr:hypothetical protein VP780_09975 [Pseudomonas donghuensis]
MLMRTLLGSLLLLGAALKAQALPTENQPQALLLTLGAELANNAGSSQWQQLWQRTRQAGHLGTGTATAHFTVPQAQLAQLVAHALATADQAQPLKQTQVLYRRDFHPSVIGKASAREFTALCVWVDWRSFPLHGVTRPASFLGQVSLLLARPCE